MIAPPPVAIIRGTTAWHMRTSPMTFTAHVSFQISTLVPVMSASPPAVWAVKAALLTTMSIRSRHASAASTIAATDAASAMSVWTNVADSP